MLILGLIQKVLRVIKVFTQKSIKKYPCSFAYKLVCVDDKFIRLIVAFRGENATLKSIESILKRYEYCKEVMKKHFNKNLIMTEEEGQF